VEKCKRMALAQVARLVCMRVRTCLKRLPCTGMPAHLGSPGTDAAARVALKVQEEIGVGGTPLRAASECTAGRSGRCGAAAFAPSQICCQVPSPPLLGGRALQLLLLLLLVVVGSALRAHRRKVSSWAFAEARGEYKRKCGQATGNPWA
jgi:hypothetical protein